MVQYYDMSIVLSRTISVKVASSFLYIQINKEFALTRGFFLLYEIFMFFLSKNKKIHERGIFR